MTVAPRALLAELRTLHAPTDGESVEVASRVWGDLIRTTTLTARLRNRPIVALLPFKADFGPLWRLAARIPDVTCAWQGPGETVLRLGVGRAVSLEAACPADLPGLFEETEALIHEALAIASQQGVAPDLARAYGGVAFDPAAEAEAGSERPLGRFTIPEIALRQDPDRASEGVVAVLVEPGRSVAEIERSARRALAKLSRAARTDAPVAARGPSVRDLEAGRSSFENAVELALRAITDGQVDKVVLARDVILETGGHSPWQTFELMALHAPQTARYAFALGPGEVYFGASPERLVALSDGVARCDCLAGTLLPGDVELKRPKEHREHDVVVQAIQAMLAPLSEAIELAAEPVWRPAPGLVHLWSPLSARLKPGVGIGDVVLALHPTPAVGGWPRRPALDLIRSLEGRTRGWYAGAVGWLGAGQADFAVGIRGVDWRGDTATLTVGAGIVPGSTPQGEWLETRRKAEAVLALAEVRS